MHLKLFLFPLIFILLSFSLVTAEQGCLMFPESALYCLDVEEARAKEECSSFPGCVFEQIFYPRQNCEDKNVFPHCEQVLCKSFCSYEFLGKCPSGSLLPEEENQWCAPGCCYFKSSQETFCSSANNKWSCITQANDQNINQFYFNPNLNEEECLSLCNSGTSIEDLETITPPPELPPLPSTNLGSIGSTLSTSSSFANNTSTNSYTNIIIGLAIFVIIFIVYFIYRSSPSLNLKDIFPLKKEVSSIKKELFIDPKKYSPFYVDPDYEEKLNKMKKNHQHKVRQEERDEFLMESGIFPSLKPKSLDQLQKVVQRYEHKTKNRIKQRENLFAYLQSLGSKKR